MLPLSARMRAKSGDAVNFTIDMFADDAPHQLQRSAQRVGDVYFCFLQIVLAAEPEQLSRQFGCAIGRVCGRSRDFAKFTPALESIISSESSV